MFSNLKLVLNLFAYHFIDVIRSKYPMLKVDFFQKNFHKINQRSSTCYKYIEKVRFFMPTFPAKGCALFRKSILPFPEKVGTNFIVSQTLSSYLLFLRVPHIF